MLKGWLALMWRLARTPNTSSEEVATINQILVEFAHLEQRHRLDKMNNPSQVQSFYENDWAVSDLAIAWRCRITREGRFVWLRGINKEAIKNIANWFDFEKKRGAHGVIAIICDNENEDW